MQMPSFKLARTAKWRLRKSLSACYEHIENWKVKAFRKVFIWLCQPCSVQASHSWLPFHPLERNTDPEFKPRCLWWHLQTLAQFCPGTLHQPWKQLGVARGLKWDERNNTCSFLWDCQPFNSIETHTRGCQRAVHTLPTSHTQLTCGLFPKKISMAACPYVTQLWLLHKTCASDRNTNFCCSNRQDLGKWFVGSGSPSTAETHWWLQYYREGSYKNTKRGQDNQYR